MIQASDHKQLNGQHSAGFNPLHIIKTVCLAGFLVIFFITPSVANEADVINVAVQCHKQHCQFDVTVQHADSGWDHYANQWEVLSMTGEVIATRVLHHPHVQEQPFTRSLRKVKIPSGTRSVIIRATDSVHGIGGKTVTVTLSLTAADIQGTASQP